MEAENEFREPPEGAWADWKRALAGFAEALGALGSLRWEMAKAEATEWGRAALVRALLFAAAAVLAALGLVFLVVALVLVLQLLLGSLLAAVLAAFGICVIAAGGLVFAATRRRWSKPMFERTSGELRKDFEAWTGGGD